MNQSEQTDVPSRNVDEALAPVSTCLEDLANHLGSPHPQVRVALYVPTGRVNGLSIGLEAAFKNTRDGAWVVWDYVELCTVTSSDIPELLDKLSTALKSYPGETSLKTECLANWETEILKLPNLDANFRFHPLRFGASSLSKLGRNFATNSARDNRLVAFLEEYQAAMSHIASPTTQAPLMLMPFRRSLNLPQRAAVRMTSFVTGPYKWFARSGYQIFDFPDWLLQGFLRTDVSEMTLGSLGLPYESCYLSFSAIKKQLPTLAEGWHLDGAYISKSEEQTVITLTTSPPSRLDYLGTRGTDEPLLIFNIPSSLNQSPLETTVESVIAEAIKSLEEGFNPESFAEFHQSIQEEHENAVFSDVRDRNNSLELSQMSQRQKALGLALRLVLNAGLYLTAYRGTQKKDYPVPLSDAWQEKIKRAQGNERKQTKIESELKAHGFHRVYFCANGQSNPFVNQGALTEEGKERAVHWRRGHWRLQPFGSIKEDDTSRPKKLIWIMPVVVGAKDGSREPEYGHVYQMPGA